jgi:hypothetical protein
MVTRAEKKNPGRLIGPSRDRRLNPIGIDNIHGVVYIFVCLIYYMAKNNIN